MYVALSGWNSARICDITRGQALHLSLYIDLHNLKFFMAINSPFDQKFIHKCMNIHHSPIHTLGIIVMSEMTFLRKVRVCTNLCTVPLESWTTVTSIQILQDIPPERATYININVGYWRMPISWLDLSKFALKLLLFGFKISLHSDNLHKKPGETCV